MATVMLDAGHGGFDNGAMFNGRKEKDDNLSLTLKVGQYLENRGVNVIYTRTEDIYQSPNQKAGIANRSDADYFVSFHRNSSPEPDTYSGIQTLVYQTEGIPLVMAQNINKELVKVGFKDLGIIERPNLAVLRGTRMPAVLVETGFINTEADNNLFDERNDDIARGIADAIIRTISGAAGKMLLKQNRTLKMLLRSFQFRLEHSDIMKMRIILQKTYRNSVMTVLLKRADTLITFVTDGMMSMLMQKKQKKSFFKMLWRQG